MDETQFNTITLNNAACLGVTEDSQTGLEAALRAQMPVWQFTRGQSFEKLFVP